MTASLTRTSQAVAEWTKIFPKQIIENYTSSVTFMKQLTVIAVSTITYLKNAFPEDSYSLECFGGLKLRVLKKNCRDELANFLSTALTQAFEAFDKKYLHQLALCFYEDECNVANLIEYHVFEYAYTDEGITMSVQSSRGGGLQTEKFTFDGVRERTVNLIRACVVIMQTCQNHLPDAYDVSLRLYYNETAPEGYQAPGFTAASEADEHLRGTRADTIKLGCVQTPHHRLTARSYIRGSEGSSREAIPSQNPPMMSQIEQEEFMSSAGRVLRCACRHDDDDDNAPTLTCQYCNTVQHAPCYGLMSVETPRAHCCCECADRDSNRQPTDPRLADLTARKRECLCIFRRALWSCSRRAHVSLSQLESSLRVSGANAAKLLRLLRSHAVLDQGDDADPNAPHTINPEQLKIVISKFFQVSEEETMVDRLLAETFSQESHSDPLGDVLSPMERVTLENETMHGTIINNPQDLNKTTVIEDLTIKQYKEALLSNYQNEEPLGGTSPMKEIQNLKRKRIPKRKMGVVDEGDENRPNLRTGVRTKRVKTK